MWGLDSWLLLSRVCNVQADERALWPMWESQGLLKWLTKLNGGKTFKGLSNAIDNINCSMQVVLQLLPGQRSQRMRMGAAAAAAITAAVAIAAAVAMRRAAGAFGRRRQQL